jgi:signal transduction histidine kinase
VEVRTEADEAAATLTVRDHGPGLPDGETERIFDPFYTTKPGGTGLGLAVAQQVVHQHGGSLSADSADGGGARFTLALPVPVEEIM